MTASGYNALLILLFSGTLIIAAVAPCHGEAVVDISGEEVLLSDRPGIQYWIRYLDLPTGSRGHLSSVAANGSRCQRYVTLLPEPSLLRSSTQFLPTSCSNQTVMQLGELYEYVFLHTDTGECNAPGRWTLGNLTGSPHGNFRPIVAGQELGTNTRQSWFSIHSAGVKGIYWLHGCSRLACGIPCPNLDSLVRSYELEGSLVLGVGVQDGVLVQFERIFFRTAEQ